MQKAANKFQTPDEYLDVEVASEHKSEYYKGEIFAMTAASVNHNRIAGNLFAQINSSLQNSQCEVFISDLRIWIEAVELFTYPDLVIVCNRLQLYKDRNDTITNPFIIFEILSESTKNYDRGNKFEFYRSLSSFQEYVLVDQSKDHIEHFFLEPEKHWIFKEYNNGSDTLQLSKINFQMTLSDIYRRVVFDTDQETTLR